MIRGLLARLPVIGRLFHMPTEQERFERDARKAHGSADRKVRRFINKVAREFVPPVRRDADGLIYDGGVSIPYILDVRLPGSYILGYCHTGTGQVTIPVWGGQWHWFTMEHEYMHSELFEEDIFTHDPRWDRLIHGWAATRRNLGYQAAASTFTQEPVVPAYQIERLRTPEGDLMADTIPFNLVPQTNHKQEI